MNDSEALFHQLFTPSPRKGDRKKAALVDELISQIAKNGLESVSLDSVGKALGMRRSHVVYYFPTLEALVEAAVQLVTATVQRKIVAKVDAAETPRKRLAALLDANLEWMEEYPKHLAVMLVFWSGCLRDARLRALYSLILAKGRERLVAILTPVLRPKVDAPGAASEIQNWLAGFLLNLGTTSTLPYPPSVEKKARAKLMELFDRYCLES